MAARKVIALFDRAEARDFADMLDSLARFTDEEIPVPAREVLRVRAFTAEWAARLRTKQKARARSRDRQSSRRGQDEP